MIKEGDLNDYLKEEDKDIPTIIIEMKKRSLIERILRVPYLIFKNYRTLRKGNGVWDSFVVSLSISIFWVDGRAP